MPIIFLPISHFSLNAVCGHLAGSFCISPLQHSVYHLPNARIHCPIYMYREHLYATMYIAFLPSMLHP